MQVLARGELGVDRDLLGDHAQALFHHARMVGDGETLNANFPVAGLQKAADHGNRRGLSRAIGTQKSEDFSLFDGKGDPIHRDEIPEVLA